MVGDNKKINGFFMKTVPVLYGIAIFMLNVLYEYPKDFVYLTVIAVMAISIYLVLKYKNRWELLIIFAFLFYYNYSIVMAEFVLTIDDFFTIYAWTKESYIALNSILLYMIVICMFSPAEKKTELGEGVYNTCKRNNGFVVLCIALVLVLIFIFGYKRPEANERGAPSPLYEYSIIFFIVGYMYAGKAYKKVLTALLVIFALQNFIFGGRVTGLQLILIWFLVNYSHKAKLKLLVPVIIVALIAMGIIGSVRGNYSGFNLSEMVKDVWNDRRGTMFVNDTAYSAYHTSVTFIKSETVGWGERLRIFKNYMLSMILGGSKVPDSNLAEYTHRRFMHYYGGVLPVYCHFFMGYAGVVLSSFLTLVYIRMISKINEDSSAIVKCISIYITSGLSRWYLYAPSNLMRGVMLLSIVYMGIYAIDNLMYNRYNRRRYNGFN